MVESSHRKEKKELPINANTKQLTSLGQGAEDVEALSGHIDIVLGVQHGKLRAFVSNCMSDRGQLMYVLLSPES